MKYMEEINLVGEIERLEALYKHYKRVYRGVLFLCCSEQTPLAKEKRNHYKNLLQETRESGI